MKNRFVEFVVLTAVTMFWDVIAWSPEEVHRHFGASYYFHLQGRKLLKARTQQGALPECTELRSRRQYSWGTPLVMIMSFISFFLTWIIASGLFLFRIWFWKYKSYTRQLVEPPGRGISPLQSPLPIQDNTHTQIKSTYTSIPRTGLHPLIPRLAFRMSRVQ
jgi:hypothetical protein